MLLQQGTPQLRLCDGSMKTIRCMPPLGFDCTLVYYKLAFSAAADPPPPRTSPAFPTLYKYIYMIIYNSCHMRVCTCVYIYSYIDLLVCRLMSRPLIVVIYTQGLASESLHMFCIRRWAGLQFREVT